MASETVLYMVIPCYNEQEVLPDSAEKLKNKISDLIARKKISKQSNKQRTIREITFFKGSMALPPFLYFYSSRGVSVPSFNDFSLS